MAGDVLPALAVLAALVVVYAMIMGAPAQHLLGGGLRGRAGRPPSGIATRYADPTGGGPAAVLLTVLALNAFTSQTHPGIDGRSGAIVGLLLAVAFTFPITARFTGPILSILGVVAAVIEAVRFVADPDQGVLGHAYRAALVLLSIACFTLSAMLFHRSSALAGSRGLVLFGLIDIATFLAGPAGTHLYALTPARHALYLVAAGAVSLVLGWAASELTLGLTAAGVAAASFSLSVTGVSGDTHMFAGPICAIVVYILTRLLVSRLL